MNIHFLRPAFTIQGYTAFKVENILSCFLPANKWKQVVANTMFFYISVGLIWALSNFLQLIETNIFLIFFEPALKIFTQGPWYQILHVLPSFLHIQICHFQDGGDVTNPAGLSPCILPRKCKSSPMPLSWAKHWRQKSANPVLFPRMSPGSTPWDGRW